MCMYKHVCVWEGETMTGLCYCQSIAMKKCRGEDTLKRKRDAKVVGRRQTPVEDGSDEDRTDESQQVHVDAQIYRHTQADT